MNESVCLGLALLMGLLLGAMFFGGLWWTVHMMISSRLSALWFLGSLLLRTSLTMVGLYFISAGHWTRLVACLLGFVMARTVMTSFARQVPRAY